MTDVTDATDQTDAEQTESAGRWGVAQERVHLV